jgi:hypothetical protein
MMVKTVSPSLTHQRPTAPTAPTTTPREHVIEPTEAEADNQTRLWNLSSEIYGDPTPEILPSLLTPKSSELGRAIHKLPSNNN